MISGFYIFITIVRAPSGLVTTSTQPASLQGEPEAVMEAAGGGQPRSEAVARYLLLPECPAPASPRRGAAEILVSPRRQPRNRARSSWLASEVMETQRGLGQLLGTSLLVMSPEGSLALPKAPCPSPCRWAWDQ